MFFGTTIEEVRQLYFTSWRKFNAQDVLTALEQQLVQVILDHPEYHSLLTHEDTAAGQSYFPELGQTNPFLHMGLHLALREQISTDRPPGIKAVYEGLLNKHNSALQVEHLMIDCLAECLWLGQKNAAEPDIGYYFELLTKL